MYWMTILWLIVTPFSRSQLEPRVEPYEFPFSRTDELPYGDCERFGLSALGPYGGPDSSVPCLLCDALVGYADRGSRSSYDIYLDEAVFTCWSPSFRRGFYSSVAFIARFHCLGRSCGLALGCHVECTEQCVGPYQEATACCIGHSYDRKRDGYFCVTECDTSYSQDIVFDESFTCRRQVCSNVYNITRNLQQILVNISGILCVQCLLSTGRVFPDVVFVMSSLVIIRGSPLPDLLVNEHGMLMIFNAVRRLSNATIQINCETEVQQYQGVQLISITIIPLSLSIRILRLHEGDSGSSSCLDMNHGNLISNQASWLFPLGVPDGVQVVSNQLTISNARRHHSGEYTCAARYATGDRSSVVLRVVVEYSPEISSEDDMHILYGSNLAVTCEYGGVPTPSLVWVKDGVHLSMNDRTFINMIYNDDEDRGVSILTIINVVREDRGLYICRASSSLGTSDAIFTVFVAFVLDPPTVATIPPGTLAFSQPGGAPSTYGSVMMYITCAALCLGQLFIACFI